MADTSLTALLRFMAFTHRFQQVKRAVLAVGEERPENDAEHSYQLALVAWYICETQSLPLDRQKILQLALIHDLVEVFAGDTPVYQKGGVDRVKKQLAEEAAAQTLAEEFPEFPALSALIQEYEQRHSEESVFIYALDKILPPLNNYLDQGRSWQLNSISLEHVVAEKTAKVAISPTIAAYFAELTILLQEHPELFIRQTP